jgi:hypothetical protein
MVETLQPALVGSLTIYMQAELILRLHVLHALVMSAMMPETTYE